MAPFSTHNAIASRNIQTTANTRAVHACPMATLQVLPPLSSHKETSDHPNIPLHNPTVSTSISIPNSRTKVDDGGPFRHAVQPQPSTSSRKRSRSPGENPTPPHTKRARRMRKVDSKAASTIHRPTGLHEQHTPPHLPAEPSQTFWPQSRNPRRQLRAFRNIQGCLRMIKLHHFPSAPQKYRR